MLKYFYFTHRWNKYYHPGLVDLEVMAMKRYSTFPIVTELEPHHQIFGVTFRILAVTLLTAPSDKTEEAIVLRLLGC